MNVECTRSECEGYGRMFDKDQRELPDINNTLSATFFDITEDVSFVHHTVKYVAFLLRRAMLCKAWC